MFRVVPIEDLRANGHNLSIPLYTRPVNGNGGGARSGDGRSLKEAIAEWQRSSLALRESMSELFATLKANRIGESARK